MSFQLTLLTLWNFIARLCMWVSSFTTIGFFLLWPKSARKNKRKKVAVTSAYEGLQIKKMLNICTSESIHFTWSVQTRSQITYREHFYYGPFTWFKWHYHSKEGLFMENKLCPKVILDRFSRKIFKVLRKGEII